MARPRILSSLELTDLALKLVNRALVAAQDEREEFRAEALDHTRKQLRAVLKAGKKR